MEPGVRDQLLEMSRRFYVSQAVSFDQSRRNGWNGWNRVLAETSPAVAFKDVLDVGCGNGRFLSFLRESGFAGSYLGVDSSEALIANARERYADVSDGSTRFEVGDVLDHNFNRRSFDLVVCFGVFHHVPGFDTRAGLLERIASTLQPGGIAVISLWQPQLLPSFEKKLCDPILGLEENDFLISWNGDCQTPRYCHHFDEAEIKQLVGESSLELLTAFQGENNDATNHYVLVTRG